MTNPNFCPKAPDGGNHHMVSKRAGRIGNQPTYVLACKYCDKTSQELREERVNG